MSIIKWIYIKVSQKEKSHIFLNFLKILCPIKKIKIYYFLKFHFGIFFYSRRCKTKSIMRVQRKARARDWLHFMSTSSCHLRNDYKPLLTCRSRSNQNKDVIKMRGQISLSCETSRCFHLTWVFPANGGIDSVVTKCFKAKIKSLNGGSCINTTGLRISIGELFSDQLIRNSKFSS